MDSREIQSLLDRYEQGIATEQERALLESWYNRDNQRYITELNVVEIESDLEKVTSRLPKPAKTIKLWPGFAAVQITWKIAAALTAIVFGIWFYTNEIVSSRNASGNDVVYKNDITPGRNTATITLANGKTISLSDAKTGVIVGNDKLAYSDGSTVANLSPSGRDGVAREVSNNKNSLSPQGGSLQEGERSKVQMLTASTPRGGTYQITLPDGTKVWLNAASALKFPSSFNDAEQRVVKLDGEAYFEVAKAFVNNPSLPKGTSPEGREVKKRMPFIIESAGQTVEVLGTHFNINSYADEAASKTTLLEGSIQLSPRFDGKDLAKSVGKGATPVILKPGEQLTNDGKSFKVNAVYGEQAIAWKNNKFTFEEQDIKTIMRMVERWYNVDVVYSGNVTNKTYSGSVSRFDNVSKVLSILEITGNVHFKIEGRRITVIK